MGRQGFRFGSCLFSCLLALLTQLATGSTPLSADEFRTASLTALRVDWRAALDQLRSEINAHPAIAGDFVFTQRRSVGRFDPRARPALVQVNAISSQFFSGIARSSIPVLLPFDVAAYLEAQRSGAPATLSLARYQSDFNPPDLFDAGPAGYDANKK